MSEDMPLEFAPIDEPYRVFPMEDVARMPAAVVLERSFVVAALERSAPGHDSAAGFLERMVLADTTLFCNDVLELQLQDAAFDLALREVRLTGTRSEASVCSHRCSRTSCTTASASVSPPSTRSRRRW
ncbi:hypothetical protein BIV03_17195 [Curtobacterium sp. MCBA15_016]|nr:hypothetical protein BIV03_17195 [Curtobacterium sp. MCBA15_016]